ncbi:MAG: hypothetical protein IT379_14805 [Deltaproteobacteria bacterium]|nr:hypothetical protein [Deltaproteobacteria bacterium]
MTRSAILFFGLVHLACGNTDTTPADASVGDPGPRADAGADDAPPVSLGAVCRVETDDESHRQSAECDDGDRCTRDTCDYRSPADGLLHCRYARDEARCRNYVSVSGSCALDVDGQVWCWSYSAEPVLMEGLPRSTVVQVGRTVPRLQFVFDTDHDSHVCPRTGGTPSNCMRWWEVTDWLGQAGPGGTLVADACAGAEDGSIWCWNEAEAPRRWFTGRGEALRQFGDLGICFLEGDGRVRCETTGGTRYYGANKRRLAFPYVGLGPCYLADDRDDVTCRPDIGFGCDDCNDPVRELGLINVRNVDDIGFFGVVVEVLGGSSDLEADGGTCILRGGDLYCVRANGECESRLHPDWPCPELPEVPLATGVTRMTAGGAGVCFQQSDGVRCAGLVAPNLAPESWSYVENFAVLDSDDISPLVPGTEGAAYLQIDGTRACVIVDGEIRCWRFAMGNTELFVPWAEPYP